MWYDILVGCILLFFLARGAARGLVWQLAGILGILLCITFAGTASKVIGPHINLPQPTNQWAVMFITYLLASLVAFGFARTLNGWIEKMEMKEYNRHLGAVFGLLKGALLVLIMTFMIVTFSQKSRDSLKDSRSARIAARMIHQLEPLVPDKMYAAVGKYIQMFDATGFVTHDPNAEVGVDEVLPPERGSPGEAAPVDDGTTLGQAKPFDPYGLRRSSPPSPAGSPTASDPQAISPDLATELRKTVGTKVSRMIEEELLAATPQAKARLEQSITDALQSADPQSKRQLQERLLDQGQSGALVQLLDDWAAELLAGGAASLSVNPPAVATSRPAATRPPVTASPPPKTPAPAANGSRNYLDEIVAVKSQFPSIQKKLKAEYAQVLQMLPQGVSSAVTEDWYGDLTNSATDVDPETDSKTALETRIIRQLDAAGYPESKLLPALQARLKQFRMTAEGSGVLR